MEKEKNNNKLAPKITRVDLLIGHHAFREVTNIEIEKGKFRLGNCAQEAILKRP